MAQFLSYIRNKLSITQPWVHFLFGGGSIFYNTYNMDPHRIWTRVQFICGSIFCLTHKKWTPIDRALCRIKLLPVAHVLVDTWMWTVKTVYKLLNVSDDLKWTTSTCDTIFTHFQGITNNIYGFGRPFLLILFFLPVRHISTRPYSFLPVQKMGGRLDGSLPKSMLIDYGPGSIFYGGPYYMAHIGYGLP